MKDERKAVDVHIFWICSNTDHDRCTGNIQVVDVHMKRKNKTGKTTLANKLLNKFKCLTGKPLNKKGRKGKQSRLKFKRIGNEA